MKTINLSLDLASALSLLRNTSISSAIRDDIEKACLQSVGINDCSKSTRYMNLTLQSVPVKQKIRCIGAVKNTLVWGLKESKDFVDVVLGKLDVGAGKYDNDGYWESKYINGTPNTLTEHAELVRELANQLSDMGCDVFTDTYNCI
jgi:ribosomal protein L7/L12